MTRYIGALSGALAAKLFLELLDEKGLSISYGHEGFLLGILLGALIGFLIKSW